MTTDEIKRFIALLIYFGVVHVRGDVAKNWSTKTLYHGLWACAFMTRNCFSAILAMFHVVDPATETPGDKLQKLESFVSYFKNVTSHAITFRTLAVQTLNGTASERATNG